MQKIKKCMCLILLVAIVIVVVPGQAMADSGLSVDGIPLPGGYAFPVEDQGEVSPEAEGYGSKVVDAAKSAVGSHYNLAGLTPETGFTATSFIVWCLNESGCGSYKYTDMEHLYARASDVSYSPHAAGDVVFFVRSGVEHAGIYIGDGKALVCGTTVEEIVIGSGEWSGFQMLYGKYTPNM